MVLNRTFKDWYVDYYYYLTWLSNSSCILNLFLTVDIVKFNGATSRRLLCKSTNHTRPGGFIYIYIYINA